MRPGCIEYELLTGYLNEDTRTGDLTTDHLIEGGPCKARIISRERGIVAGLREVENVFGILDCTTVPAIVEGAETAPGMEVCSISGPARALLRGERVALNILGRMSGIATLTRKYVDAVRTATGSARVAATRKTTPGFRHFEKRAVVIGGGDPHRYSLDDMVLIKENHIRLGGGIDAALQRARERISFSKKIEIEVESFDQFETALAGGADIIMLDNMSPEEVARCRRHLEALPPVGMNVPLLEVSGNINLDTISDYAANCDIVSVGALTHSYRSLDFSMLVE